MSRLMETADESGRLRAGRDEPRRAFCTLMAIALVLDASVSLAWFLKETPDRAAYAAAGLV